MVSVGILTVSDRASAGEYEDRSGQLIAGIIRDRTQWIVAQQKIVADNMEDIVSSLLEWCSLGLNLILTTGGTGFSSRDVTPEATLQVLDRLTPGIAEAMRSESLRKTPHAMLSRAAAGIRDQTLIINLPGSPRAVKENLDVILPVLPHAIELLTGQSSAESSHRSI